MSAKTSWHRDMERNYVTVILYMQWCIGGGGIRGYTAYTNLRGFFGQRILTSVIINKQGTFRPFATPLCVYPPPFLGIHHCIYV